MFGVNKVENGGIFYNPKEDAAVNIDVCSEDATVHVCASAFTSKKETLDGKARPR